jgi:hypothetical protein
MVTTIAHCLLLLDDDQKNIYRTNVRNQPERIKTQQCVKTCLFVSIFRLSFVTDSKEAASGGRKILRRNARKSALIKLSYKRLKNKAPSARVAMVLRARSYCIHSLPPEVKIFTHGGAWYYKLTRIAVGSGQQELDSDSLTLLRTAEGYAYLRCPATDTL